MKNLMRNTLIAVSLLTIGQNLAKAGDFTVTTRTGPDGSWVSEFREAPAWGSAEWLAARGVHAVTVSNVPNGCERGGVGGFETITRLAPGESRCTGAPGRR